MSPNATAFSGGNRPGRVVPPCRVRTGCPRRSSVGTVFRPSRRQQRGQHGVPVAEVGRAGVDPRARRDLDPVRPAAHPVAGLQHVDLDTAGASRSAAVRPASPAPTTTTFTRSALTSGLARVRRRREHEVVEGEFDVVRRATALSTRVASSESPPNVEEVGVGRDARGLQQRGGRSAMTSVDGHARCLPGLLIGGVSPVRRRSGRLCRSRCSEAGDDRDPAGDEVRGVPGRAGSGRSPGPSGTSARGSGSTYAASATWSATSRRPPRRRARRMAGDLGLDLGRVHPDATDLHLVVDAALGASAVAVAESLDPVAGAEVRSGRRPMSMNR